MLKCPDLSGKHTNILSWRKKVIKAANVLLTITTVLLALAMVLPQAGFAQGSGKALDFDGTDDYVTQSYDSDFDFGTGSFIASGWFKTSGAAGGSGSISVRVSASSDDAEEAASGGNPNITSSDLELVYDQSAQKEIGMRFFPPANFTVSLI